MKHGEAEARKTFEEARQAVIKACADLREAEMFLDAFKSHKRSAVGGAGARAASSADIANTHASNLRESAVGGAAAEYLAREGQQARGSRVPDRSAEILEVLQTATGVSRVIVPADRGEMAESILLSVAEDLNRAVEALGYPTLQVMLGDDVPISQLQHSLMRMSCVVAEKYCSYVENGLRVHASGESGVSTCAECRQAESR